MARVFLIAVVLLTCCGCASQRAVDGVVQVFFMSIETVALVGAPAVAYRQEHGRWPSDFGEMGDVYQKLGMSADEFEQLGRAVQIEVVPEGLLVRRFGKLPAAFVNNKECGDRDRSTTESAMKERDLITTLVVANDSTLDAIHVIGPRGDLDDIRFNITWDATTAGSSTLNYSVSIFPPPTNPQ